MRANTNTVGWSMVLAAFAALVLYACDPWAGEGGHSFPLIGEHATLSCEGCHTVDLGITTLPSDCASCHIQDRPEVHSDSPCEECHTPFGWLDIQVDHDFFPLLDAHDLDCMECHEPDDYFTLDPTCSSCHEADRPPDHYEGTDCAGCHTPTTWEDGTIDHSFFPLQDAHNLECNDCHDEGDYTGLSSTCSSCHEVDRPNNHFQGECEACHVPTTWDDADFDHRDYFPIPHEGNGNCNDCHLNDDGYQTFSCIDCHAHGQNNMANEHDDVNNYRWESNACLDCHPNGQED